MDASSSGLGNNGSAALLALAPGRHAVAAVRNVLLHVWLESPDETDMAAHAERVALLLAEHPEGHSMLHWVRPGIAMPSAGARRALQGVMRRFDGRLGDSAIILEGGGFWVSAMRAFITGLRIGSGDTRVIRPFSNIGEATRWLPAPHLKKTGVSIGAHVLGIELARLKELAARPRSESA